MNAFHLYLYGPDKGPIGSTFEAACERLESLESLHFEPDGSFVWIRDGGSEQIYGMLYDAAEQLRYGELQGKCRLSTWRSLTEAICGEIDHPLNVMMLPERVLQDLQSFEASQWP